jgi:subtilase family serine protease
MWGMNRPVKRVAAAACALTAVAWAATATIGGAAVAGTGADSGGTTGWGGVEAAGLPAADSDAGSAVFVPESIHIGRIRIDQGGPGSISDCEQQFSLPCYDPAELQQAYDLPALYGKGLTGKGTTIVVVDAYGSPTIWNDLVQFDGTYGLPNPSLKIIKPAGRVPSYNSSNAAMVGWAGETTLDVEYSHAIAPGANILVVETPTADNNAAADFNKAEDYVVKHHLGDVISQSFGTAEQAMGSAKAIQSFRGAYKDAEKYHVTVLAAAGDTGATDQVAVGNDLYTYAVTQWPATDPLVTAVGGSEVHLDSSGNKTSPDTVWNDTDNQAANQLLNSDNGPSAIATGGGRSSVFSRPSYQNGVRKTVGGSRGIPDVSMNGACSSAVNVYQSFPGEQPGWYAVCGTSESTPMFAGIVALAAQKAGHSLGLINPALYKLSGEDALGIVRITSGNNTVTFPQNGASYTVRGYTARNGYSRVAGVGTINAQYFVPELARLG